jgi:hypothetical protein
MSSVHGQTSAQSPLGVPKDFPGWVDALMVKLVEGGSVGVGKMPGMASAKHGSNMSGGWGEKPGWSKGQFHESHWQQACLQATSDTLALTSLLLLQRQCMIPLGVLAPLHMMPRVAQQHLLLKTAHL